MAKGSNGTPAVNWPPRSAFQPNGEYPLPGCGLGSSAMPRSAPSVASSRKIPPTTQCRHPLVRPPSQCDTSPDVPMPPSWPCPSTTSVFSPLRAAARAAPTPDGPPPQTTTS